MTPEWLRRLESELPEQLSKRGVSATVESEGVPQTKLFRIYVTSPEFVEMSHMERQDLVWRIIDDILSDDEQLNISMVLTIAKEDVATA